MKLAQHYIVLGGLFMGLFFSACSGSNQSAVTSNTSQPQIAGADKDAHGCKASAGYQWSVLKTIASAFLNKALALVLTETI